MKCQGCNGDDPLICQPFSGKYKDVNAPEVWEHYAGYAHQLALYTHALQSAEFRVIDTLIYYPVQGRIIRIK